MIKKLYLPDLREEWKRMKQIIEERNKKYSPLTKEEIKREVEAYRREKYKR